MQLLGGQSCPWLVWIIVVIVLNKVVQGEKGIVLFSQMLSLIIIAKTFQCQIRISCLSFSKCNLGYFDKKQSTFHGLVMLLFQVEVARLVQLPWDPLAFLEAFISPQRTFKPRLAHYVTSTCPLPNLGSNGRRPSLEM